MDREPGTAFSMFRHKPNIGVHPRLIKIEQDTMCIRFGTDDDAWAILMDLIQFRQVLAWTRIGSFALVKASLAKSNLRQNYDYKLLEWT